MSIWLIIITSLHRIISLVWQYFSYVCMVILVNKLMMMMKTILVQAVDLLFYQPWPFIVLHCNHWNWVVKSFTNQIIMMHGDSLCHPPINDMKSQLSDLHTNIKNNCRVHLSTNALLLIKKTLKFTLKYT